MAGFPPKETKTNKNKKSELILKVKTKQWEKIVHFKQWNHKKIHPQLVDNQILGTYRLHNRRNRNNVPKIGDTSDIA